MKPRPGFKRDALGAQLYRWRVSEYLNQREAAARLKVSRMLYVQWERSVLKPNPDMIERLEKLLGSPLLIVKDDPIA